MQPASSSEGLAAALADGNVLLGTPSPSNSVNSMETILKNRLSAYYGPIQSTDHLADVSTVEDLRLLTAKEAISVLKRVQNILNTEEHEKHPGSDANIPQAPSIGTRDLAQLRTLLSLAFKWGLQPLFTRISQMWLPKTVNSLGVPKTIDSPLDSAGYQLLSNILTSLFSLVFPDGQQGRISQTLITTTILSRHVSDLLLPAIAFGWLPESLSSSLIVPLPEARPFVKRILTLSSPAQGIVALGGIISSTSPPPPLHVHKTCTSLMSQQLLRPEGVQGLYVAMFSAHETNGDEVKIEKLEHSARILNTAPANMKSQEYYQLIFPRVLKLLAADRNSYRRAAAFTVYRAVVPQKASPHQSHASSVVLEMLHSPFLERLGTPDQQISGQTLLEPRDALLSLTVLISNTEPSPTFISKMLSPILPSLYLLFYDLGHIKTAAPSLKESVTGLLISWGKIVDPTEGTDTLWSIVEGGNDIQWEFNLEGQFWKTKKSGKSSAPSLLLPGHIPQTEGAFDADLNLFNLYPDPVHFVQLLKLFDRGDIASALFLRLLENYRDTKGRLGEDSMRILHKLQIIVQMQNRLSGETNSNILRNPDHLLSFIFHVLDSASISVQDVLTSSIKYGSGQVPSRRNIDEDNDMFEEGDSDDEVPDSEVVGPDDELIETAITLLLSILEVDHSLSARTHPIFNDIFSKLEPLALKGTSTLRPLAQEARLVITARLAQIVGVNRRQSAIGEEDGHEIYQRALKLLQDPILPVRAHGLLLLRHLAGPTFSKDQSNKALVPSILSIFLQSVQDQDSYIFLNAVQGLAALVDSHGKEILQGLVRDYTGGLDGLGAGNLTQHDIDIRTRIGEALSSVIKRCGNALGLYVDILVPSLFATVRGSNIPTTLRTSALSLLADAVDTYPWAMLPYVEELCQAIVDLLQIESQPLREHEPQPKSVSGNSEGRLDEETLPWKPSPSTVVADPTPRGSKLPTLRRAALHFLSLLIRASTKIVYGGTGKALDLFSQEAFQRISLTLGYVSATDEDDVVRVMATEAKENLEGLQRATFGL